MKASCKNQSYTPLKFKNEDFLRQAIANLYLRIDNVKDVQILHGQQEYGKDIIFKIKGGIGEDIVCACVVKNDKISGKVDDSKGARTVLLQAQQAFDTPYTDGFGDDIQIERVYIMTPFPVNQITINSIKGALKNYSQRTIVVGGSSLFELFKEHWPDFIAEEQSEIDILLSDIVRELSFDNNLDQLTQQYGYALPKKPDTKKIYVEPSFHIKFVWLDAKKAIQKYMPKHDFLVIPGRISKGPDDPGSSPKPIKGNERKVKIRTLKENLDQLKSCLRHFKYWNWLEEGEFTSDELISNYNLFAKSLIAALENSIIPIGGENLLRYHNDLTYLDSKRLSSMKNTILQSVKKFANQIDSLKELNENSKVLAKDKIAFLTSHDFQAAQECLNTHRFFSSEDVKEYELDLGKNLFSSITQNLLIVAPAGYGKTSFCRWQTLLDIESYKTGHSKTLPIYIPLHRLRSSKINSFGELLANIPLSAFIVASDWVAVREGKIKLRIYLDGLDEIPSEDERIRIVGHIKEAIKQYPDSHCIITARDYVHGPWLSWLVRVSLSGLDSEQQLLLVSKWFEDDSAKILKFNRQFEKVSSLHTIMIVPLLSTLIILVYMRTGRLLPTKVELYKTFIDLLCGGWDLAKGVLRDAKFGKTPKMLVLCKLAGLVHDKKTRVFKRDLFQKAISLALSKALVEKDESLIKELIEDGIVIKSGNGFEFAHFSFQEFLAAKDLANDIRVLRIREVLRKYIDGDNWWKEVISFYIGLHENPQETAKMIADLPGTNNASGIGKVLLMIHEQFPECGIDEEYPHYILLGTRALEL